MAQRLTGLQRASAGLLVAWLLVTGWLTLRPDPAAAIAAARSPWSCVVCGQSGAADLLLNLLLFAPLGWLLGLRRWRFVMAAMIGFGISLSIELSQGFLIPGRDAALGDVIANGSGTLFGWGLVRITRSGTWLRLRRWLAPLSTVAFLAMLVGSGDLLAPDWGGAPPLRLIQPPDFPDRPVYRGGIGGLRLRDPDDDGAARIELGFVWSAPDTMELTPIVRLEDGRGNPVVAVDRRGDRVAIESRIRAAVLRLRAPTWSVAVPRESRDGDGLLLSLQRGNGSVRLDLLGAAGGSHLEERLGAQHGWVLLNPFSPITGGAPWHWWTWTWLAGWGLLLGLAARMQRWRLAWGLAAIAGLLLISGGFGAPANPPEVLWFAAGWLAGVSSARFRRSPAGA